MLSVVQLAAVRVFVFKWRFSADEVELLEFLRGVVEDLDASNGAKCDVGFSCTRVTLAGIEFTIHVDDRTAATFARTRIWANDRAEELLEVEYLMK